MQLVIVDSGCANVASVRFAFERLGVDAQVSADAAAIRQASHVILPGVGTAATFMRRLRERGLVDCVRELRQPCLGICLGMQLMFERSEEGDTEAIGVFPGRVRELPAGSDARVPHMGWNQLSFVGGRSPMLAGIEPGDYVYFVHSYYVPPTTHTVASTSHGAEVSAVVAKDNFFGCQFHPERSGEVGARVLGNFLKAS